MTTPVPFETRTFVHDVLLSKIKEMVPSGHAGLEEMTKMATKIELEAYTNYSHNLVMRCWGWNASQGLAMHHCSTCAHLVRSCVGPAPLP